MNDSASSAYVHVPFCSHRCGYCDFTLVAKKDHLVDDYLTALAHEMSVITTRPLLETLFLGGGTPTHLTPAALRRLLELLHQHFEIPRSCEFSVEANPFGLTDEKLDVLREGGVNRISLGIQSFDAAVLQTLERDHRRTDIVECVSRVRERFDNIGFDLIFAVPGQTLDLWHETLDQAISLRPTHLSTYGLTFEKGTAFWARREKGLLSSADEELELAMYEAAIDRLTAAGFEQYEISNFARPGYASRHNQVYWTGRPFWGFGPGAASLLNGTRRVNHRSVTTWIKAVLQGESALYEEETLSPEDRAREALVLGLRRTAGVNLTEFQSRTGFAVDALLGANRHRLETRGWLEATATDLRLTRTGRCVADTVAGYVLTAD